MAPAKVAVIEGDGIGVDVTEATLAIMAVALEKAGQAPLQRREIQAGAAYYHKHGLHIEPFRLSISEPDLLTHKWLFQYG